MRAYFDYVSAPVFSDFLYKGICCWYSFELPRLVEAIQKSNNNTCFYKKKKVDKKKEEKKNTDCNLKSTGLLDCAFTGVHVCAVISSNMEFRGFYSTKFIEKLYAPRYQKNVPLDVCVQRRFRSACA